MHTEEANLATITPIELRKCDVGVAVFNSQYGLCIVTDRNNAKERLIVNLNTGMSFWADLDVWFVTIEVVVKYDGNTVANCKGI